MSEPAAPRIGEALRSAAHQIQMSGSDTARLDAQMLLCKVLNFRPIDVIVRSQDVLPASALEIFNSWVNRRILGEPIAYILGEKDFYGRRFEVGPAVLIPRPESEFLVSTALEFLKKNPRPHVRVLDLGCGSGCIGLTLLCEILSSELLAVEISPPAIAVAKNNAHNLGLLTRSHFLHLDAAHFLKTHLPPAFLGEVDVVVANPPYIADGDLQVEENVKKFEPRQALFSGPTGLEWIHSWAQAGSQLLAPSGVMIFEIGAQQGEAAKEIVEALDVFDTVGVGQDYAGLDRFVVGSKDKG